MSALLFVPLVAAAMDWPEVGPPPRPTTTLEAAAEVLDDFRTLYLKRIPPALMADAHAVAVVPNTVKAGFLFAGRRGRGVVFRRDAGGKWGDPTFVTMTGFSAGFQAGVESTDVVLVFRSDKGLERVLSGKGSLSLGADASVAAGPLGREAGAATNVKLEAEVYSYSRSRGLFAGASLEGVVIANDRDANDAFRRDARPEATRAADQVRGRLLEIAPPKPGPAPPAATPKSPPGP